MLKRLRKFLCQVADAHEWATGYGEAVREYEEILDRKELWIEQLEGALQEMERVFSEHQLWDEVPEGTRKFLHDYFVGD